MTWPVTFMEERIDLAGSKRISADDAARQRATAVAILDRLKTQPGVVLADEVGMGKTFVALAVAASVAWGDRLRRPIVVMVPPALRDKWPRDFKVFVELCLAQNVSGKRDPLVHGVAETGIEFLQLLDDPRHRRVDVIFLTHGALHRGLSDPWTKLAILRHALRPSRFELQRKTLHRFAADLLRTSSKNSDPEVYERLLGAKESEWRGILQSAGFAADDDPVPEAIAKVLSKNRVDFTALRDELGSLPVRRSASITQRINEARRAIALAMKDVWREALREAQFHSPLLILDEAHHLKNPATRLASLFVDPVAAEDMGILEGALKGRFERMLFLTATPFQLGHHELMNVLNRFTGIHWDRRHIAGSEEEFTIQMSELGKRLDATQKAALTLDEKWRKVRPADVDGGGEDAELLEQWWARFTKDPGGQSEQLQIVHRAYVAALERMREANEALRPWVIRHLRARTLPGCNVIRRVELTGAAIENAEGGDHPGLAVKDENILPFLLAARSQAIFGRLERTGETQGARRATFAEGLASSYEAFLDTRAVLDAKIAIDEDESLDGGPGLGTERLNWYLSRLEGALPNAKAFSEHPKVAATRNRVLALWAQGEKVLVFCHFRKTGRAMAQHLSAGMEDILLGRAAEVLGTNKNDADLELGRISARFGEEEPLGRDLRDAVMDVLIKVGGLEESEQVTVVDVVRRFARTDAFLVRYFPLAGDKQSGILEATLSMEDGSGLSLRKKITAFAKFIAERCVPEERAQYLEALLSIQPGERRGTAVLEDGSLENVRLQANIRLVHGGTRADERRRVMLTFNTPFFPEILVASNVLAEGVDLHLDCRYVIHHDLCWNPSTLEQRTGRIDRIDAKAERVKRPINVFLPYIAATQDEKMFRVVRDRERWFQVLMGEDYDVDEAVTDQLERRVPLPRAAAEELAMKLNVWDE